MSEKPIPEAFYPCISCYEEYSHIASDLYWSEPLQSWCCDNCWSDQEEHWTPDENTEGKTFSCCEYGISLEEELKNRESQKDFSFSKNMETCPLDESILIMLINGNMHAAIKRKSKYTFAPSVLKRKNLPLDWSKDYFIFEIEGIINTEYASGHTIEYKEVIAFSYIPKIKI